LPNAESVAFVWGSGAAGGLSQAMEIALGAAGRKGRKQALLAIAKLGTELLYPAS